MLSKATSEGGSTAQKKAAGLAAVGLAAVLLTAATVNKVSTELAAGSQRRDGQGFAGYVFFNIAKNYAQASQHCKDQGMVLATVDSAAKAAEVKQLAGNERVWIGYQTRGGDGKNKALYRWDSNAQWNRWTNWANGQPDLTHEKCTEQLADQKWNNLPCSATRKFVCDRLPYVQSYAMHGAYGGASFDEANAKCREYYGTGLATLTDTANMASVMQQTGVDMAWVGLRVKPGTVHNANNFQNVNGKPRAQITWRPNEPNNYGGSEACAEIRTDGKLNDRGCQAKVTHFLCDQFVGNLDGMDSAFEQLGDRNPVRNWRVPFQVINYNGKNKYSLFFDVRVNAVNAAWSNVLHIGTANDVRIPGVWLYRDSYRRFHFRQRGVGSDGKTNWNLGCDPSECDTPKQGQYFRVSVLAEQNKFTVKYDNVVRCTATFQPASVAGDQPVYLSDPWHIAAPVSYRNMGFYTQ